MATTLTDVLIAVRELSFDRFPLPSFTLQRKSGHTVTISPTNLVIKQNNTPIVTAPFSTYSTLQALTDYLVSQEIVLSYSGYFIATERAVYLLRSTDAALSKPTVILRRFFFSDEVLKNIIIEYYSKVLSMTVAVEDLADEIERLDSNTSRHLTLWCAIIAVKNRRIYEVSASTFDEYFTDGSGGVMRGNAGLPGNSVSVNIGGVFTLQEENTANSDYFSSSYNLPGSDNVLGDKESFWFKLYLHLREFIEVEFKDNSFRPDAGMFTDIKLEKPINLRTYFDSYPYTISPLARGILY